ncbi:glycine zipper 2TM domain-containing protein [Ferrimonas gelatinilytica]
MSLKPLSILILAVSLCLPAWAQYNRNRAVPVEQVSYGEVESVRDIQRSELVEDRHRGWKVFGGALLGGLIGNQFGSGSGRDVATVLGALAGAGVADRRSPGYNMVQYRLQELIILTEAGERVMVVQDYDPGMVHHAGDSVRIVYLSGGLVRVDRVY